MLNQKQTRFVEIYLQTGNATESAKRSGYSQKTAYAIGSKLLKHIEVSAAIAEGRQQATRTAGIDAAAIAARLAGIAFADVGEPVKLGHQLKALELLSKLSTIEELARKVEELTRLVQQQSTQSPQSRRNGYALIS